MFSCQTHRVQEASVLLPERCSSQHGFGEILLKGAPVGCWHHVWLCSPSLAAPLRDGLSPHAMPAARPGGAWLPLIPPRGPSTCRRPEGSWQHFFLPGPGRIGHGGPVCCLARLKAWWVDPKICRGLVWRRVSCSTLLLCAGRLVHTVLLAVPRPAASPAGQGCKN